MSSKRTGAQVERGIATTLTRDGWTVIRSGSSGAGTDRDLPDVIAGKFPSPCDEREGAAIIAVESKYRSDTRIRLKEAEVEQLTRVAESFGAIPLVFCRWSGDTTAYGVKPEEMERTDAGNYSIGHEQAHARANMSIVVEF